MVEWKKLGDLGSYFGGLTGKTKKDFEDGNAKFITYMNVFANPSLDESTVGMVHINEGEKQNKVQKGDILFTGSSETPDEAGMSCVVTDDLPEDYYMNSFCFGLRLNNSEQFNLHYLKHLLRSYSIRNAIAKTASGVTRFNISKARFGSILIPIPSLSEQTRIVGILDTFTASIENLKQQIALRRKQYEHYRDQLLDLEGKEGVEMMRLEELFTFKNGLNKSKEFFGTGKPIIMFTNVFNSRSINASLIKSRVNVTDKELERINACVGDVFFTRTSETKEDVGYASVLIEDVGECTFSGFLIRARPITNKFLPNYCKYCFSTPKIRESIVNKSSFTTRASLTGGGLGSVVIAVPSLPEQQRIVSILDTFEASIANLERQLAQRERQYEYYRNKLLKFE